MYIQILWLALGRDKIYLVKKSPWFKQKILWNWHLYWQHICYNWRNWFSTNNRHSHDYKLCSFSWRLVSLFICNWLHLIFFGKMKISNHLWLSLHTAFSYKNDVLSLNYSKLWDFVEWNYPNELEGIQVLLNHNHVQHLTKWTTVQH